MLVKNYKKEHNERMKTERDDKKKTFTEMLNNLKDYLKAVLKAIKHFFRKFTNW